MNSHRSIYSDAQRVLLQNALTVVDKVPSVNREREEPSFKNMWNFNLPDAAFGWVLLDIKDGRVSAETKAQGIFILCNLIIYNQKMRIGKVLYEEFKYMAKFINHLRNFA